MKNITLAQFKKECGVTPKDMKGWSFTCIIRTVTQNAEACFVQGYLTRAQKDNAIRYGVRQANKGNY